MFKTFILLTMLFLFTMTIEAQSMQPWVIDTQSEWTQAHDSSTNIVIADGFVEPTQDTASFQSILKTYPSKQKAKNIIFAQSPVWDNWTQVADIAPPNVKGAPVFLPIADKDYWFFAKEGDGYHAWHSTDLKNWIRYGVACASPWVIDAEYVPNGNNGDISSNGLVPLLTNKSTSINLSFGGDRGGKFYIYYDNPNDEDPSLAIDDDPTDDQPGQDYGMVFADPTHGSDAGIFRDDDETWYLFYEDWSPINARTHSWDSSLGGRVESPDGIHGFQYMSPDDPTNGYTAPIDHRTTPTGRTLTYSHPNGTYTYEEHLPEQDAYGDYSMIKIGSQYYLFSDYDPIGRTIRVGKWTSSNVKGQFTFIGEIGDSVHPDPSVGFAEGKFYIVAETTDFDFESPGPWVDSVQVRVGVDVDNDQTIDTWTEWQSIAEQYSHKPGYAKIVNVKPAKLDLTSLPEGYGFKFEFQTTDTTTNSSKPIIDKITMSFQ